MSVVIVQSNDGQHIEKILEEYHAKIVVSTYRILYISFGQIFERSWHSKVVERLKDCRGEVEYNGSTYVLDRCARKYLYYLCKCGCGNHVYCDTYSSHSLSYTSYWKRLETLYDVVLVDGQLYLRKNGFPILLYNALNRDIIAISRDFHDLYRGYIQKDMMIYRYHILENNNVYIDRKPVLQDYEIINEYFVKTVPPQISHRHAYHDVMVITKN